MALIFKDRVKETCSSPGTGTITLLGPVAGFAGFSRIGTGNTTYYTIADQTGTNWEVGIGTWTTGGSYGTLSRNTVYANSLNTTAKIDFASGTQDVFLTLPSQFAVQGSTTTGGTSLGTSAAAGALGTALGATATTGNFGTALGSNAAANGSYSVALGGTATTPTGGTGAITVGYGADSLGTLAITVGYNSAANPSSIAIGPYTNVLSNSSIAVGASIEIPSGLTAPAVVISADPGGFSAPNEGVFINNVRDETEGAPDKTLKYDTVTKEIFYGTGGGGGSSPATPTVAGVVYGNTTALSTNSYVATLGYGSSALNNHATSLGANSTCDYDGIALGFLSSALSAAPDGGSIAIGRSANSSAPYGLSLGYSANVNVNGTNSVAIGKSAVTNYPSSIVLTGTGGLTAPNAGVFIDSFRDESAGSPNKILKYNTSTKELFYGAASAAADATPTVAGVVYGATDDFSGSQRTILGFDTTCANGENVAVGRGSIVAGVSGTAVGAYAQVDNDGGVAIGQTAQSFGTGSIALGNWAVTQSAKAIAIGSYVTTPTAITDPTIVIVAGGTSAVPFDAPSNGVFMDSFRDATTANATLTLKYNEVQNELAYDPINLQLNPSTISQNISIPAGFNASLIGPITLDNGYSITVEDGANFVVVT